MKMKMGRLCIERQKPTQKNSCINCFLYRKNKCPGDLEVDLLRQTEKGYELYYPLQQLLKDLGLFMLSTEELLKKLEDENNLKIDRTLLFKYANYGFIEKVKKTSAGKSQGVKTYWKDNSADKINCIRFFKDAYGLKFKDLVEYMSIITGKKNNYFFDFTNQNHKSEKIKGNGAFFDISNASETVKLGNKVFFKEIASEKWNYITILINLLMKLLAIIELGSAGYLKDIDVKDVWKSTTDYYFAGEENYSEINFADPVNKKVRFSSKGAIII